MMKRMSVLALAMSLAACGGSDGDSSLIAGAAQGSTALLQTVDTGGAAPGTATPVPAAVSTATAAGSAFLIAAYQDGLAEIRMAELAATRAASTRVRDYARAMIEQHTIVNAQIQQLAQQKSVNLPTEITPDQAAAVSALSALSGDEFDRSYMRQNVAAHDAAVADAMREARTNDDIDARFVAAISAPLLKTHLGFGEDLLQRVDPAAFVASAYQSSRAEVAWAQVALQRATDEDVRRFAQDMVDEHTEANARITTFAAGKSLPLPAEISAEQQAIADDLARFSGADFDRAYMDANVVAHAKAVRFARKQASDGLDVDVRSLARSLAPDLAAHLVEANELSRDITPSFLYSAGQSNLAEIRFGYLGALRSTDASIRDYGQRMATEHTPVQVQLEQLAQASGVVLPLELSPEQQLAYSGLAVAQGQSFDAGFAAYNERLHDRAIERFTDEIEQPGDARSLAFAQALLPTLTAHRAEARDLLRGLGGRVSALLDQLQALRDAL